jgi:hypothetical protein
MIITDQRRLLAGMVIERHFPVSFCELSGIDASAQYNGLA